MPKKRRRRAKRPAVPVPVPALPKPSPLAAVNLGLRFSLEMTALVVLGFAGFNATENQVGAWALALGAPAIASVVWGAFVSPKAPARLDDPARLVVEVAFFALATLALVSLGSLPSAVLYSSLVALHLTMMFAFKQRGA